MTFSGELVSRAVELSRRADPAPDPGDDHVFDAALGILDTKPLAQITMDEIAAASGVGRATLFRHYGSKQRLFERLLARDTRRFLDDIDRSRRATPDPIEHLANTFAACLDWRDHPMLNRRDPAGVGEFLADLGSGDPSPLFLGQEAVAAMLLEYQRDGSLPPADARRQAEILVHLMLGYLASPGPFTDLTDRVAVRELAVTYVAPIVLSPYRRDG